MRRLDGILTGRLARLLSFRPELDGRFVVLGAVAVAHVSRRDREPR